jgi:hypothetical protein
MNMTRTTSQIAAVAGALIALAALSGCTGATPGDGGAAPAVPTLSTRPTSPAVPAPPTTESPTSPTPAAPPAPPPAQPDPAVSGECKAAELSLSLGQGDAAAGTLYRPLRFTNTGTRTCVIQGFPGVSYVAGDDGHQVGPAAFREGTKGSAVSLPPGASANAPVGFVQVRNYDPGVCRPTAVRGLRVYPPHDTAAMFVPMDGTGCAGKPPGNQLVVKTVQSGPGR